MDQDEIQDNFLENILKKAETLTKPPSIDHPMPEQIFPKWLRFALRSIYLPVLLLDLFMQKLAKKIIRPPFKTEGKCKKRGNCCYYILLPEAKGLISKIYFFWQTQINGFFIRQKSPPDNEGNKMLILGCRHLMKDGSCEIYKTRPSVCRKWPIIEHFGRPRILKGCGYQIVLKKSYQKEPYISLLSKIHKEVEDR